MADKTEKYLIQVVRPDGVDVEEMVEYIEEAVDSWSGQFHPDNPLFNDNECSVERATVCRLIREASRLDEEEK